MTGQTTKIMAIPDPGSKEAIEQGWKCPRMDNKNELSAYIDQGSPIFWYSQDCALYVDGNTELSE